MVFICFYDFPYIGNVIIPTVTHSIIFRGRAQPPPDILKSCELMKQMDLWARFTSGFTLFFRQNLLE